MHIPDGYIAPAMTLGAGVLTVPIWGIAARRVQNVLSNRTVPLLAIFAALSFTIMMFNIPVPGGTTAHGVGGTLIAIILGPWAAIIAVSLALILQALFFGDGGVLAIFINCLNMAVILPFVGYGVYRLIAGRAPVLSPRRIWAAGIGAYAGITASALAVGLELGVQPLLFSENGHAMYSPYGVEQAVPAMLIAHAFGASIVEALIGALGVAYFQKNQPHYLTSLRRVFAGSDVAEGRAASVPLWQLVAGSVVAAVVIIFGGSVVAGGADWSQVAWDQVGIMMLVALGISVVVVGAAYVLVPKRLQRFAMPLLAIVLLVPLGLIAPGFAYGEGAANDVQKDVGYVPTGLDQLSKFFSGAPLPAYRLPFIAEDADLWQQALGYYAAAIVGMALVGLIVFGVAYLLRGRKTGDPTPREVSV